MFEWVEAADGACEMLSTGEGGQRTCAVLHKESPYEGAWAFAYSMGGIGSTFLGAPPGMSLDDFKALIETTIAMRGG